MAVSISLDCNDLEAQAPFWCAALDDDVLERAPKHIALVPRGGGAGVRLYLNHVEETKTVKNRSPDPLPVAGSPRGTGRW